jgi:hypothetical protein
MRTFNLIMTITLSLGLLSCNDANAINELDAYSNAGNEQELTTLEFTSNPNSLTASEKEGLLLMREEEKLAGDVYAYFYEKYALRPFTNINKSEVRHSDAVLRLLNYFGLKDPALTEAGKFSNEAIQTLYNKLTADGSTAELALATGAFIEEYDIADLNKLMNETQNADIKMVYNNLLNGSYNHIRAFTRVLAGRGVIYKPTILSATEYSEIVEE